MNVEDWLGKDNALGIEIWNKKYRNGDESFDAWLDRVSGGKDEVKQLILQKKFLFGGRILANRGVKDRKYTLSNCYCLSPPEDSIESIFETAGKLARTFSYGGGVGIDLSKLAPRGAKVNNSAGESTGAVSFTDLYSMVTGLIGQQGRRGALMLSLSCDHPDLEEFINLKTDLNRVTKANVSVRASNHFMHCVKYDLDYELYFKRDETDDEIVATVPARKIFQTLCDANYDYGEPGILFWDDIKRGSLMDKYDGFEFAGVNPSLVSGTKVLTKDGIFSIEDLQDKVFEVPNLDNEWSIARCFLSGRDKKVIKLTFSNGEVYEATPEHRWAVLKDNNWVKTFTSDLKVGDVFPYSHINSLEYGTIGDTDEGFLVGFLFGDGSITNRKDGRKQFGFTFGDSKIKDGIMDRILRILNVKFNIQLHPTLRNRGGKDWYECSTSAKNIREYMELIGVRDKHHLPDKFYTELSEDFRKGFVDGLFSADGGVDDDTLSFTTSNAEFMNEIRKYLMWYGISGSICTHNTLLNGKLFTSKVLKISKHNAINFRETFHISRQNISEKLNSFECKRNLQSWEKVTLVAIDEVEELHDVWDITVYDTTHCFRLNGVITGNCAEQPLPAGGSCLLGSMNLAEYVYAPGKFDIRGFETDVQIAVKALNEVLNEGLPLHPLQEQRDAVKKWKQIGLGIMGLGDMLVKMGIKYGSTESFELCDDIGKKMFRSALIASANLKKGHDDWDDALIRSDMYKYHFMDMELFYPNNSQLLTIAPTGSISTMIGVSGGIEPIFAKSFTRRTVSLSGKDEYHEVYPTVIKNLMDDLNVDIDHLPDYVVTSSDIPWFSRVVMQATWQKHIDASISSTINLPEYFPKDEIMDIYLTAWELGCKGLTIFRQGCKRDAILTTDVKSKDVEPSTLVGKKRKLMTGCGSLHCTVFFDSETGDLKEVFLNRGSDGGCMSYMNAMSRLASLSLRSGCTADEVINQLKSVSTCPSYAVRKATKGDTSKGSSCPMAVANALQEMCDEMKHKDDVKSSEKSGNPCPNCGSELQFSGGCNTCPNCGWSKCD